MSQVTCKSVQPIYVENILRLMLTDSDLFLQEAHFFAVKSRTLFMGDCGLMHPWQRLL